ncbi:MAG: nicotinate-nucleotide adenylyltransferase [Cytophagales bacterium]|nr:MAG: nicotinate-nucleotide adenylyltransferase [Cytophagales bacterium]TAF60309.1 MAG: nicotinate-nucleotide adenylyltransferase [Cytophagales bacterium]
MSKVGLYFGSFNPVHVGHLIVAQTVCELKGLDQVWFIPSPQNPFKAQKSLLSEYDRLEMVRLAIAGNPLLDVCDLEYELPKPSFTIDTLQALGAQYPDHQFFVLVGEDNLKHFEKWKKAEELVLHYHFLVFPRPHAELTHWHQHPAFTLLKDVPLMDISATFIRNKRAKGQSIAYLVPQDVENYILMNDFYSSELY